jgi:hypothetical protein
MASSHGLDTAPNGCGLSMPRSGQTRLLGFQRRKKRAPRITVALKIFAVHFQLVRAFIAFASAHRAFIAAVLTKNPRCARNFRPVFSGEWKP